jgi:type II secretory pathway predicted ATPase ExeA
MTSTENGPNKRQKRKLRSHFGFSKMPFNKSMWAKQMFDSESQRELHHGLEMWTEIAGFGLVTGHSGVGKSISLRRFVADLDESRFNVVQFTYLPTTVSGFLRSLARALGIKMHRYGADLFDAARAHLTAHEADRATHPIIIIDDAEGLSVEILDVLRRLTTSDLDAEDRFSILLAGTEEISTTLRHPSLESLRSRIAYAHALRPFTLEDTRAYVRFHLERAEVDAKLFSDDAIKRVFLASQGKPRHVNQLALHVLIAAAVMGRDTIDGNFIGQQIAAHPLYQGASSEPTKAA